MKANARARRGEDGISNVLGAILMFGLLVLTLVVIQVRYVPVWGEDREARTMLALADDLSRLKADLDSQASNDTATALTQSLPLGDGGGFRFFQAAGDQGSTVMFQPSVSGAGLQATTTKPVQLLRRDGEDLFGLSALWPSYVNDEIDNVGQVTFLRLRVDMNPIPPDASNIRLNVYDATDDVNPIGWAKVTALDFPSEKALYLQVFNEAGAEVSSSSEAYFQQTQIDYKYFDLLGPELLFKQILLSGQAPFRLELIQDTMVANYQIAYTDFDSGNIAGATGVLDTSGYSATQASGRIEVAAHNTHYVDQTYILEHGAILVEQDSASAAAMIVPPALGVTIGPLAGSLQWTAAGLTGDGLLVGGDRVTAVATPVGAPLDVWLQSDQFRLLVPTSHAGAWATYLDSLLRDAGWTSSQYTLTQTSASLQVDLEGPIPNDAACTSASQTNCSYDVVVRLRLSPVDLVLAPG